MAAVRSTKVFLPCHTLDDFPTWLQPEEADDLLAAWVAAWHPSLIAAASAPPEWASVDLPADETVAVGIVPARWDDRFAAQFDGRAAADAFFVRRVAGSAAIARAAAARLVPGLAAGPLPGEQHAADFEALGLAVLLADLLARRMRSGFDIDRAAFATAVTAAARAAVEGRDDEVRPPLAECFASLEASRGRYYPVDSWIVDLVLLAPSTTTEAIAAECAAAVPVSFAASGATIRHLAAARPAALALLREAAAAGRIGLCGGLDDDRPLDSLAPEEILDSFERARSTWREHVGGVPASFVRLGGGSSALLPQLIAGFGCRAGVWSLFDGSPLPDVGTGLVDWQAGGASVAMLASAPLDATSPCTTLALPDTLGDAMDRDHVATAVFAHYAGAAGPWHPLLRRIGGWCGLLGQFTTPDDVVCRASGSATPAMLEPDAFPPALPPDAGVPGIDPVETAVAAHREAARRILADTAWCRPERRPASPAAAGDAARPTARGWLPRGLFGSRARPTKKLVLETAALRVEVHPRSGGLLALRRPVDRGNRLSQRLAVRTTRPQAGAAWESPEERACYTSMLADEVAPDIGAGGIAGIVARGRLVDADGGVAARFLQRLSLDPELPLAVLDIEIHPERTLEGPLLESHFAARFAWHENEHVEIRRSLHTQSVATERGCFTAPHFIQIVPHGGADEANAITVLSGGVPWHLVPGTHVLDSILAGGAAAVVRRRLAVGIGIPRPWDAGLALLAAADPALPAVSGAEGVRITVRSLAHDGGRVTAARVGLLESAGRAGSVSIDWGRPVARAVPVHVSGEARADVAVAIEGGRTVVSLDRYQWLHLDLDFAG